MTDRTDSPKPEPVHPSWELDYLVTSVERDADKCASELARNLRSLADELIRNAERVERGDSVNSSGIIQSRAMTIDAAALQLSTLRRIALSTRSAVVRDAAHYDTPSDDDAHPAPSGHA